MIEMWSSRWKPGISVGEAARLLHGTHAWFGQVAHISCLLSTRESIESIVANRVEGRVRLADLERHQKRVQEEQDWVRQEQPAHATHLEWVFAQFSHKVQKVEELQKNVMAAAVAAATASAWLVTAPQSATSIKGPNISSKISKLPVLPQFLGAESVPKEQWRFQVIGAQKVCIKEAVHSVIVWSVRGKVREMISFLGFDANLNDILDKVEKCFGKQLSGDCLQQEFYQLSQDRNERIRHVCWWIRAEIYISERKVSGKIPNQRYEGPFVPRKAPAYLWINEISVSVYK